jgi:hypothetical protein
MEAMGHVCLASIMTRHNSPLPVVKPGDHKPSTGARLRPKTFSPICQNIRLNASRRIDGDPIGGRLTDILLLDQGQ